MKYTRELSAAVLSPIARVYPEPRSGEGSPVAQRIDSPPADHIARESRYRWRPFASLRVNCR
ncbi:MAG: hypothetical protein DMF58_10390 [Acidobacteria bacterium]|nr:MAG: hypothetical protein DMF58_10390 [Acidobacteriota bacterium]